MLLFIRVLCFKMKCFQLDYFIILNTCEILTVHSNCLWYGSDSWCKRQSVGHRCQHFHDTDRGGTVGIPSNSRGTDHRSGPLHSGYRYTHRSARYRSCPVLHIDDNYMLKYGHSTWHHTTGFILITSENKHFFSFPKSPNEQFQNIIFSSERLSQSITTIT